MQVLWEEALGVPGPGVRLQMTCKLRGGGGGDPKCGGGEITKWP